MAEEMHVWSKGTFAGGSGRFSMQVVGLVKVTPKQVLGDIMTIRNWEEEVIWK